MPTDEREKKQLEAQRERNERYWRARIAEDERAAEKNLIESSERIRKMYETQYKKIVLKLEGLMAQVKDGKEISRTRLWNYSRWREMESSLSAFVKGGALIEREAMRACLDKIFEETIGAPVENFGTAMFTAKIDPKAVVDTAWSGERFSSRIWKNRAALADRVKINMEDMIVQGKGLSEMRRSLMDEFGVGYRQADTLLRTESNFVMNRAHVERYKTSNVRKMKWMAKNEEAKRCKICGGNNGLVYWLETAPILPAHPRCGCRWVGVIELPGENVPVTGDAYGPASGVSGVLRN